MNNSTACCVIGVICTLSIWLPDADNDWILTVLQCTVTAFIGANICAAIEDKNK